VIGMDETEARGRGRYMGQGFVAAKDVSGRWDR
jgi:hypothetical protein